MRKIAALTILILIIFSLLYVLFWAGASIRCGDVSEQTGLQTKYFPLTGCYVKINDSWIPIPWDI